MRPYSLGVRVASTSTGWIICARAPREKWELVFADVAL
jgi:hypothetical protein